MPRTRLPYPQEFRDRIVELARAGRSVSESAEEFEPSGQTICSWIKKADVEDGIRSDGTTAAEREELRQLRKELRRLKPASAQDFYRLFCPLLSNVHFCWTRLYNGRVSSFGPVGHIRSRLYEVDPEDYSAHAFRSGFITQASV